MAIIETKEDILYKNLNDYCFSHDENCTGCKFSQYEKCPLNELADKTIGMKG